MYGNSMPHYILWRYEKSLLDKGYSVDRKCRINKEQIKHISPQTPPNGESLETGYDVNDNNQYSEEFTSRY